MPRITISYRRDDSGVITGRIFDRLAAHYGREAVFRDIDNLPPGVDFRQHIARVLDESDILLAIVGPRWLGRSGGHNRLDDEADPVRLEIETGLRKEMPVIPVLVLRAAMPRVAQLPDSVKDFAYRHAVQVDAGQDFDVHANRLIRAMDRILAQQGVDAAQTVDDGESPGRDDVVAPGNVEPLPTVVVPEAALAGPAAAAVIAASAARRGSGALLAAVLGLAIGGAAATVITVTLRPAGPPDVVALAAAKEAAEMRALSLQAELAAAQKKLETAQASLDAAQKQSAEQDNRLRELKAAADQAGRDLAAEQDAARTTQTQLAAAQQQVEAQAGDLKTAQSRADKAEQDRKQLATQLAAGQDKGSAAQKLLDQQAAQLKDATARAEAAEKALASQKSASDQQVAQLAQLQDQVKTLSGKITAEKKARDETSAQAAQLDAQVRTLTDEVAAEKKARDEASAQAAQLDAQLKTLQAQVPAPPPSATAATDANVPAPPPDDSSWSAEQRREAQADLIALGHLQSSADGNFGPATRAAIKQFQAFAEDPDSGTMSNGQRDQLHEMAQRLAALLARGEASPDGVAASTVRDAAARYARGWAAEKASNGTSDPGEAVYWYGLAAAGGEAKAFTNLGILLVRGQGVAKADPGGAALLWWSGAARGEAIAMFNLGALWERGIGVAADVTKAKTWYQRAATQNDAQAKAALKRLGP